MAYCMKCGKELPPEAQFCAFCGSLRPNADGFQKAPGNARDFAEPRGFAGAAVFAGSPADPASPPEEEYRRIKKAYPLWPFLIAGLLTLVLLLLITAMLRMDAGAKAIIALLLALTVLPAFLGSRVPARRRAFKKAGINASFRHPAARSHTPAPEPSFRPDTGEPIQGSPSYTPKNVYRPSRAPTGKKRSLRWLYAGIGTLLLIGAGVTSYILTNGRKGSDFYHKPDPSESDTSVPIDETAALSGRWEGEYLPHEDTSGGVTLVDVDAPVILFEGSTAYIGYSSASMSSEAIKTDGVTNGLTVVCTYKLGNGAITFTQKSSGIAQTYAFDGTIIYFEEYHMQRVADQ